MENRSFKIDWGLLKLIMLVVLIVVALWLHPTEGKSETAEESFPYFLLDDHMAGEADVTGSEQFWIIGDPRFADQPRRLHALKYIQFDGGHAAINKEGETFVQVISIAEDVEIGCH